MPVSTIGTNSLASTAQIGSLTTASGSAPSYSARAWVNFNGTGTVAIRASGNVSSITDNGTGLYTVNFTTAMPDVNYSVNITSTNPFNSIAGEQIGLVQAPNSTSSVQIRNATTSTSYDTSVACVTVFR